MGRKKDKFEHYENYEQEINSLIPDRDIDKYVDKESVRKDIIEDRKKQLDKAEKAKLVKKLHRHQLRRKINDEKKQELEQAISKAEASQGVIVVKEGEANLLGTTRVEIAELMNRLNLNLNMQLTKSDTMNLLATLLTCNDAQLTALSMNPKVPIVIKIIIKRLTTDMQTGDMDAIEKIWDRVFGKAGMTLTPPQGSDTVMGGGIIPNTPVSREAYMVIRDTYIGNG